LCQNQGGLPIGTIYKSGNLAYNIIKDGIIFSNNNLKKTQSQSGYSPPQYPSLHGESGINSNLGMYPESNLDSSNTGQYPV